MTAIPPVQTVGQWRALLFCALYRQGLLLKEIIIINIIKNTTIIIIIIKMRSIVRVFP